WCQVWNTVWWFHHDALGHCVCEGHVIFENVKEQAGVYLLKVQVANALWMVFDELDVVTAVVGKVAGIQAQVGIAWVGLFQEAQDFAGGTDVAVSVGVELLFHSKFFQQRLAQAVMSSGELGPLFIIKGAGFKDLVVGIRTPEVWDDHEVFSTEFRRQAGDIQCLVPGALPLFFALVETGKYGASR